MAPTIILIRHAQARHNLTGDHSIHDPALTEEGLEQCVALRTSLHNRFSHVEPERAAIIASPMRRTLQTTQLALDWLIDKGVKVEADASWQENSAKPCDTGSTISEIANEFARVDFSTVDPVFPDKTSSAGQAYAHRRDAILERGRRCLVNLASRPEKFVFVVSHSGFLRVGVVGWWFFNADYRIFEFGAPSGAAETVEHERLPLTQHQDTLHGGLGWSSEDRVELGAGLPDGDVVEPSDP